MLNLSYLARLIPVHLLGMDKGAERGNRDQINLAHSWYKIWLDRIELLRSRNLKGAKAFSRDCFIWVCNNARMIPALVLLSLENVAYYVKLKRD
jgi:hypothetical protein